MAKDLSLDRRNVEGAFSPFCTPTSHAYFFPWTVLDRPWGFQEFQAPRLKENRYLKVVRLSALGAGRLYSPDIFLVSWYSFLLKAESTPGPQCGRKDKSMKNAYDPSGNLTRDLPVCSAVPQPTAPQRAPDLRVVAEWTQRTTPSAASTLFLCACISMPVAIHRHAQI